MAIDTDVTLPDMAAGASRGIVGSLISGVHYISSAINGILSTNSNDVDRTGYSQVGAVEQPDFEMTNADTFLNDVNEIKNAVGLQVDVLNYTTASTVGVDITAGKSDAGSKGSSSAGGAGDDGAGSAVAIIGALTESTGFVRRNAIETAAAYVPSIAAPASATSTSRGGPGLDFDLDIGEAPGEKLSFGPPSVVTLRSADPPTLVSGNPKDKEDDLDFLKPKTQAASFDIGADLDDLL